MGEGRRLCLVRLPPLLPLCLELMLNWLFSVVPYLPYKVLLSNSHLYALKPSSTLIRGTMKAVNVLGATARRPMARQFGYILMNPVSTVFISF